MKLNKIHTFWVFLIFLNVQLNAQVFLRLDEPDTPESIRFFQGAKIEIKLKSYPDVWVKKKIESFMPEKQTIIFDQDFAHVTEIMALRIDNQTSKLIGGAFQAFGTVWLGYGGILALTGGEVTTTDAFIGLGIAGGGYLIRKLGEHKTFEIKEGGYSLHLIDARVF